MDTINLPFVYRKCLLTGLFNNQILSYKETQKILDNCVTLELKGKKVLLSNTKGYSELYVWK